MTGLASAAALRQEIVADGITLIIWALAAITVLYALMTADDRRHIRHGRIPLQPLPPAGDDLPVDDSVTRLASWRDQAITEELARMLTEGNEHP